MRTRRAFFLVGLLIGSNAWGEGLGHVDVATGAVAGTSFAAGLLSGHWGADFRDSEGVSVSAGAFVESAGAWASDDGSFARLGLELAASRVDGPGYAVARVAPAFRASASDDSPWVSALSLEVGFGREWGFGSGISLVTEASGLWVGAASDGAPSAWFGRLAAGVRLRY
jgi:hypothetical protein